MSHWRCIEIYLRLTWPFIVAQLILIFFLLGTDQGYEIVLSSVGEPWDILKFLFFSSLFSWLVWMLTRTVISLTPNLLYQGINSSDETVKNRCRNYCFHIPCLSSLLVFPFLGYHLTVHSGVIWALPIFLACAALLCWVLWGRRLRHARGVRIFFIVAAPLLFLVAACFPVSAARFVGAPGSYVIAFVGFLFLMTFAV